MTLRNSPLLLAALLSPIIGCGDPATEPTAVPLRAAAIAVSPSSATLTFVGETTVFTATLTDQYGAPFPGTVTWTGNAPDVFSASPNGVVTAVSNGSGTVTASFQELSATASVTVSQMPANAVVAAGGEQEGLPGAPLRQPVVIRVLDRGGAPTPGSLVHFTPGDDHGSVEPDSAETDAAGEVATAWTLGPKLGPQILTASVGDGPRVRVTANGTFGSAIDLVSGSRQRALPGVALRDPIVVRVLDKQGGPFSGTTVLFATSAGHGSVTADTVTTDDAGEAAVVWTLGDSVGTQRLNAKVPSGPSIQVTATGLSGLGVCDRTPKIRQAIMNTAGRRDCADVSVHQLARIESLRSGFWNWGITDLYDDDFAGLTGLVTLNLGANQLTELSPRVFSDLGSLRTLYLSHNKLQTLPERVFSALTNLETLWIEGNPITELPERVFSGLMHLRVLKAVARYNSADATVSLSDRSAFDRPAAPLSVIQRSEPPLTLAPLNTVSDEDHIVGTLVSGLLSRDVLSGLSKLDTLSIGGWFSEIHPGAFNDLSDLRSLSLAGPISAIPEDLLSQLRDLEYLSLGGQFTSLETRVVSGLTNLKSLRLVARLVALPTAAISSLTTLDTLYVSAPLSKVEAGDVPVLPTLRSLSIVDSEITQLPAHVFANADNLEFLGLRNNSRLATLDSETFAGLRKLDYVQMFYNRITSLPEGIFSGLDNLTVIWVIDEHLEAMGMGIFSGLVNLEQLAITGGGVEEFPIRDLSNLPKLRLLWIVHALRDLPQGALANNGDLYILWLYNNQIATLHPGTFEGLSKLTRMDFCYNPGVPFRLNVALRRTDTDDLAAPGPAQIAVTVAEGTPFDMSLELSASGATLSSSTATIARGTAVSDTVTVTKSASDTTSVVVSMKLVPPKVTYGECGLRSIARLYYGGVYPKLGDPLRIFR